MVQAGPLQFLDIPYPGSARTKDSTGDRPVKGCRQILAKRRMHIRKIQSKKLEFPPLPIGQDQSHAIQPHRFTDAGRDGLKNLSQLKVRNHAVVQVKDEPQLGSFLLQLGTGELRLDEGKAIIDGQGGVVTDQGKQRGFPVGESITTPAADAKRP